MRWLGIILAAIAAVLCQATIAPRIAVGGSRPDWVLVMVVFFALHLRGWDAALCGWLFGCLANFFTIEQMGVLAICYALVGGAVSLVSPLVFKRHPLAQFAITFVLAIIVQLLLLIYRGLRGYAGPSLLESIGTDFLSALYTAIWAPPVHYVLLRLGSILGIDQPRYSHSGLDRI